MRLLSIPAGYRGHFEAAITRAMDEIARDMAYRSDEDPRIQRFAGAAFDAQAAGTTTIVVAIESSQASANVPRVDGAELEPLPIERSRPPLVPAA